MTLEAQEDRWEAEAALETPFAEAFARADGASPSIGYAPWQENVAPFAAPEAGSVNESDRDRLLAEALAELKDEGFDEAVSFLAEETEQALGERFTEEAPSNGAERERFAEMLLSPVGFEAHQYLDRLSSELEGKDIQSLSAEQLDEVMERLEPESRDLTPAGEEFIGGLIRKAKSAVKFVARTASGVAGALLGPVLGKLKALINPLLRRVLSMAIGRLPAPLQPAARILASRITSEAEAEAEGEAEMSPANLTDTEVVTESFDAALAEAITGETAGEAQGETFEAGEDREGVETRQLETLAEARGVLLDRLRNASDDEDLGPAVEQFAPAIIGALKLGLRLIGRPKVVGFLAKFVSQLIRKWVGPQLSQPLSNAIVDTGLRLVSLEAHDEAEMGEGEAGPLALASTIEDTVRRLAENEEYVFEDEGLMQMAVSEAFSHAVATHFPGRMVRPHLQQAPSLGGAFVTRRPRSLRPFSKYSRVPEVEITEQMADALPAFGGSTLGAVLRAAGARFPLRARLHLYQSMVGSTIPRMLRADRAAGRTFGATALVQPLSRSAAGLLLREPALGVDAPAAFLRSPNRIAAGQRFYRIEPLGPAGANLQSLGAATRTQAARVAASRLWVRPKGPGQVTVGFHFSEADAQRIAETLRQGLGVAALLQTVAGLMGSSRLGQRRDLARLRGEDEAQAFEELAAGRGAGLLPGRRLLARLRRWVLPAVSAWARDNTEAFLRAAAHPDAGVTLRVRIAGLPSGPTVQAKPSIAVSIASGRGRR